MALGELSNDWKFKKSIMVQGHERQVNDLNFQTRISVIASNYKYIKYIYILRCINRIGKVKILIYLNVWLIKCLFISDCPFQFYVEHTAINRKWTWYPCVQQESVTILIVLQEFAELATWDHIGWPIFDIFLSIIMTPVPKENEN